MTNMRKLLTLFLADRRGTAALEYGLIAAGIALIVLVGLKSACSEFEALFQTIVQGIQSVNNGL